MQVPELIGRANVRRHNEFIYAILTNACGPEPPKVVPVSLVPPHSIMNAAPPGHQFESSVVRVGACDGSAVDRS